MTPSPSILLIDDKGWRIGIAGTPPLWVEVPIDPNSDSSRKARELAQHLRQHGYRGRELVLALPSRWCLCAPVVLEGLPRKDRRQAMIYRLEESLPVAAEDLAADFVIHLQEALGVGVQADRLVELLQALNEHGVRIAAICPVALLALQTIRTDQVNEACTVVLWQAGEQVDCVLLQEGKPVAWYCLGTDPREIERQLRLLSLRHSSLKIFTRACSPLITQELEKLEDVEVVGSDMADLPDAALAGADQVAAGRLTPWINLRQDRLAAADALFPIRRPLRFALVAAVLLAVSVCLALLWRAHEYQKAAGQMHQEQQRLFSTLFPNQTPPTDVKSRLASQERALRQGAGQSSDVPQQVSVLALLHQSLHRLPQDLRYRVLELRLTQTGLTLEGQVRSHGDAAALAAALRQSAGLLVDPPRTEQMGDRGVAFSLSAAWEPENSKRNAP